MSLIQHRNSYRKPHRPFTTVFCDNITWLFQSSWESTHHESFTQNRHTFTANTSLPNRLSAFSGCWVLLVDQQYQGWAEFHCHNQAISINHLILSPDTDWAKKGQTPLIHLVAALFQDQKIDLIEIPLAEGQSSPLTGQVRQVWSPKKMALQSVASWVDILQIQRDWLQSDEAKVAEKRIKPLLEIQQQSINTKKRRPKSGHLSWSW